MDFVSTEIVAGESQTSIRHSVDYLCWSRMQSEAGQALETIIARKELERRAGDGLFMWGVGNAPAVAINALARMGTKVPVVFSIMKGRPKVVDTAPSLIVAWRRFQDSNGAERDLPANVIVTSRGNSASGVKRAHYALMCFSPEPLRLERGIPFDVAAYRNAGGAGAQAGASQVTALLRRVSDPSEHAADYEINLRAFLTSSYWVRLVDPVEVSPKLLKRLSDVSNLGSSEWLSLASKVRTAVTSRIQPEQNLLI